MLKKIFCLSFISNTKLLNYFVMIALAIIGGDFDQICTNPLVLAVITVYKTIY